MSEASSRLGVWNRRCLAAFWVLFGLACMGLPLSEWIREARLAPYALGVGGGFLLSAIGFYMGWRWGRVAIGLLVAPLSLLCFDRLIALHFQRDYRLYFWVCLGLLAVGFYTWVFIFTGLDRDALRTRYRNGDDLR